MSKIKITKTNVAVTAALWFRAIIDILLYRRSLFVMVGFYLFMGASIAGIYLIYRKAKVAAGFLLIGVGIGTFLFSVTGYSGPYTGFPLIEMILLLLGCFPLVVGLPSFSSRPKARATMMSMAVATVLVLIVWNLGFLYTNIVLFFAFFGTLYILMSIIKEAPKETKWTRGSILSLVGGLTIVTSGLLFSGASYWAYRAAAAILYAIFGVLPALILGIFIALFAVFRNRMVILILSIVSLLFFGILHLPLAVGAFPFLSSAFSALYFVLPAFLGVIGSILGIIGGLLMGRPKK